MKTTPMLPMVEIVSLFNLSNRDGTTAAAQTPGDIDWSTTLLLWPRFLCARANKARIIVNTEGAGRGLA